MDLIAVVADETELPRAKAAEVVDSVFHAIEKALKESQEVRLVGFGTFVTAKRKAAKQLGVEYRHRPGDLPSNREIRDQIQTFARLHEGDRRTRNLRSMRVEALRLMRLLRPFRPRLIGSVMTGHVRHGSDIDLHVFSDSPALVADLLEQAGCQFDVERKQVVKHGEARVFTHVHVYDRFNFELTVYPEDKAHYVFKSSITGKPIERASIRELEEFLAREYPDLASGALAAAPAHPHQRLHVAGRRLHRGEGHLHPRRGAVCDRRAHGAGRPRSHSRAPRGSG